MTSGLPPAPPPVKVLCVDDNPEVVEAMRLCLCGDDRFRWAGGLTGAEGLAAAVEGLDPDVVLLDLDMPGSDALEAATELTRRRPAVKVVVLSGFLTCKLVDRAVEAGAYGYLSKHQEPRAILDAVWRVSRGEFVLSPDALRTLAKGPI